MVDVPGIVACRCRGRQEVASRVDRLGVHLGMDGRWRHNTDVRTSQENVGANADMAGGSRACISTRSSPGAL